MNQSKKPVNNSVRLNQYADHCTVSISNAQLFPFPSTHAHIETALILSAYDLLMHPSADTMAGAMQFSSVQLLLTCWGIGKLALHKLLDKQQRTQCVKVKSKIQIKKRMNRNGVKNENKLYQCKGLVYFQFVLSVPLILIELSVLGFQLLL